MAHHTILCYDPRGCHPTADAYQHVYVDEWAAQAFGQLSWRLYYNKNGLAYPGRWSKVQRRRLFLHLEIWDTDCKCQLRGPEDQIDHKNNDTFDCRMENLRLATRSQNGANRRRPKYGKNNFRGVSKHNGAWQARIRVNGKLKTLGTYDNERMAALAYDAAALQVWGEFARPNFMTGDKPTCLIQSAKPTKNTLARRSATRSGPVTQPPSG